MQHCYMVGRCRARTWPCIALPATDIPCSLLFAAAGSPGATLAGVAWRLCLPSSGQPGWRRGARASPSHNGLNRSQLLQLTVVIQVYPSLRKHHSVLCTKNRSLQPNACRTPFLQASGGACCTAGVWSGAEGGRPPLCTPPPQVGLALLWPCSMDFLPLHT